MSNRVSDSKRRALKRRLRKEESCCWLCGFPLQDDAHWKTDWATEMDELLPVRQGGDPLGSNTDIHLVHRCCNNHRNAKEFENYDVDDWFPGIFHEWAAKKLNAKLDKPRIPRAKRFNIL